jgi:hypothetical protein
MDNELHTLETTGGETRELRSNSELSDGLSGFDQEYLGTFELTEQDKYLHSLAEEYHTRCEDYDRTVCTGQVGRDGILPATNWEVRQINLNALAVLKEIQGRAYRERGISPVEVSRAISDYRAR